MHTLTAERNHPLDLQPLQITSVPFHVELTGYGGHFSKAERMNSYQVLVTFINTAHQLFILILELLN